MKTSVRTNPFILALLATTLLAGCGSLPQRGEPPASSALKPSPDSPLVQIAQASIPAPELSGFRLMPVGVYALDTRIQLARRAKHSLDLQYYLIQNDDTGRLLLRQLRDAALRGVRVRLLVDDLYTSGGDPLFIGISAFPNVEVRLFNPFCCGRESLLGKYTASLADFGRLNHRMHNKLFIADGTMVVAGGRNIADEYFMRSMTDNFVDMDAFIVGAVVPQLTALFDTYWNSPQVYPVQSIIHTDLGREELQRDFNRRVDEGEQMMSLTLPPVDILGYGPISEDLDAGRVGLIWGKATAFADSPAKVTATTDEMARSMSVSMNVMDMVMASSTEVVISSPYFIPGPRGVAAFSELRKHNVKVTILTNSLASNDEPLVHTGYARYRTELLKTGVDLYELSPTRILRNKRLMFPGMSVGRLHAKTAVFDGTKVFIGSMNLDPRSASKNTELGIIAEAPQLAREVLRVIHISKLQSAYRLRFAPDGQNLEWLTMDDEGDVVLSEEPDVTPLMRFQNMLLAPFVPEQQL
ncbi:MAG: phospholipase D family protein [Betaproteobacteria bacterium]|nr:MAG: phospholipase D family protein [Betaproteobacteria bacterium]